jgi:hypothetical protein
MFVTKQRRHPESELAVAELPSKPDMMLIYKEKCCLILSDLDCVEFLVFLGSGYHRKEWRITQI